MDSLFGFFMIETNSVNKVQQASILKADNCSKDCAASKKEVRECKSLYDNNGLSRAIVASRMPSVSFGAHIDSNDVSKLVSTFKSIDPDIENFVSKLSNIFKSSKYQELNNADKKVFSATAFLNHYIQKKGIKPSALPVEAKSLIAEYSKDSRIESRINGLVHNSDLIETLQKRNDSTCVLDPNNYQDFAILKDYGIRYRKSGDVNVAKLLMENGFSGNYNSSVHGPSMNVLEDFINKFHQNGIWLPITKIPNASELKKSAIKIGSGNEVTENVVVDLANDNLEKLGFKKGVGKENFSTIGHAVDSQKFDPWLQDYVTQEGTDSLLSTSYFQDASFPTFMKRPYGFFLDSDPGNIAIVDNGNMASGFAKDFIDFKNNILSPWKRDRTKFADAVCENLKITKKEYPEIYHNISQARTLDEIKDPKIRTAVSEAIGKMVINPNGDINEVVVYCPSSTALFSKSSNLEDIPYKLRKYAQDKNIPIIDISKFG